MLFLSRYITLQGLTKNILTFYSFAGILSAFVVLLVLLAWGVNNAHVDLYILAIIPLMAITATLLVWACMRYIFGWKYVNYSLYLVLIFGQLLDASATSYGIDLHPSVRYIEQHVVGSGLIESDSYRICNVPVKAGCAVPCNLHHGALSQRGKSRFLAPRVARHDSCGTCTGDKGYDANGVVCLIHR